MPIQKLLHRLIRSNSKRTNETMAPDASDSFDAQAERRVSQRNAMLDRLELQAAVIHHLEWCVLFNEHLSIEEHHDPHLPSLPNAAESELGIWLERMRLALSDVEPRIAVLGAEHELFHQLAQQALELARQGRMDLASTLLNTDFERSRARVLDLLRQMQKG